MADLLSLFPRIHPTFLLW